MKILSIFFSIVLLLVVNLSDAQVVGYANEFLEIGGFSASQSMENSDFSSVSGSQSCFGNPSRLLSGCFKWDFALMHNRYLDGMAAQDLASAACRVDTSLALAIGVLRVGIGDIPNTIGLVDTAGVFHYDNITYFSAADYAVFLSMCMAPARIRGLRLGASAKLIYRHEGDFARAYGFGVDLAASYQLRGLVFSAILRDATGTFDYWTVDTGSFGPQYLSTGNSLPRGGWEISAPSVILSSAYGVDIRRIGLLFTGALRFFPGSNSQYILHSNALSASTSLGFQVSYMDIVYLRCGIGDFQYDKNSTLYNRLLVRGSFGAGLRLFGFGLDYAYLATQSIELGSNMITVGWSF